MNNLNEFEVVVKNSKQEYHLKVKDFIIIMSDIPSLLNKHMNSLWPKARLLRAKVYFN